MNVQYGILQHREWMDFMWDISSGEVEKYRVHSRFGHLKIGFEAFGVLGSGLGRGSFVTGGFVQGSEDCEDFGEISDFFMSFSGAGLVLFLFSGTFSIFWSSGGFSLFSWMLSACFLEDLVLFVLRTSVFSRTVD